MSFLKVFEPEGSEDEADLYLKQVMAESQAYKERYLPISSSRVTTEPKPQFQIPLSDEQQQSILQEFNQLREYIKHWERTRQCCRYTEIMTKEEWQVTIATEAASLEHVLPLDQVSVYKVLKISHDSPLWVYACLAKLEFPLPISVQALLNEILKEAVRHSPDPSSLVLVVIIAHAFGQKP